MKTISLFLGSFFRKLGMFVYLADQIGGYFLCNLQLYFYEMGSMIMLKGLGPLVKPGAGSLSKL